MKSQLQESIDTFLAAIKGRELNGEQAKQLATALHASTVDSIEMNWVATTFEDVADSFVQALEAMPDEVEA